MHAKVHFTTRAAAVLKKIRQKHRSLVLLLDDSSCCSNSCIMLREREPSWAVSLIAKVDGVRICINPVLERSLRAERILIDSVDFADDSLSLETNYGKRLIMSVQT